MPTIKVLTYNILGYSEDASRDTDERKARIVKAVEASEVDIAFFQEVKTVWRPEGGLLHCSESHFRDSRIYQNGCFFVYADQRAISQNAEGLLTRLPVKRFEFGTLPMGLFGRAFLLVAVDVCGVRINLLTSHLEPPAIGRLITQYGATQENQDAVRITQLYALEKIIAKLPAQEPLIVGGDFNMEDTVPEFKSWIKRLELTPVFPDSGGMPRKTFATHPSPAFDCGLEWRLDHIFYRSGANTVMTLVSEGYIFEQQYAEADHLFYGFLSDHRGVYGEFSISAVTGGSA